MVLYNVLHPVFYNPMTATKPCNSLATSGAKPSITRSEQTTRGLLFHGGLRSGIAHVLVTHYMMYPIYQGLSHIGLSVLKT